MLGLGNIGPLAAKPVMEGKAVLFKKFAGIDVFDIEIDELDPDKLVEIIAALEPTFGGINLEDIKAPECFDDRGASCGARMKIPVFHDDQHGTAIIVGAAILNGLRVVGKTLDEVKLVTSGAGAAALACLDSARRPRPADREHHRHRPYGVVYAAATRRWTRARSAMRKDTNARTLGDVIGGADIFLGLSAPDVLKPEMVGAAWRHKPLILALGQSRCRKSCPRTRAAARPDAIIATGRSDYPEPGQQRPVLPVHLPRRARCRRDHDQRGDEARLRRAPSPIWRRPSRRTSSPPPMAMQRSSSARTISSRSRSIRA